MILQEGDLTGRLVGGRIIPHGPNACIDSRAASDYLNDKFVMEAIHVQNPGYCWSVCSSAPGWHYTSTRPDLPTDTYPFLLKNIDVVVFNGDWDACVPYTDNDGWTKSMGFPVKQVQSPSHCHSTTQRALSSAYILIHVTYLV